MSDIVDGSKSEENTEWAPAFISTPPLFIWPPRPLLLFKYIFGYPGYFLPRNICYMMLALVTWFFLTPNLESMRTFNIEWMGIIYVRNLSLMLLVFGGWHFRFYILRAQGNKFSFNKRTPQAKNRKFLFGNQVYDNMFYSILSGCTIWTGYEIITMWVFANDLIPFLGWASNPIWFVILFLGIPLFRDAHFYIVHRILHNRFLYKHVHALHHKNVDIGPWSGLAMHPFEHLLYFSGVLVHWVVLSHPIHAILHVQATGLTPALGHLGFDKYLLAGDKPLTLGQRYFHYLHHKYFECNYGGDGTVPMDKWFNSFHDGSEESNQLIIARRKKARISD
jgi:sterol desaturase/sphingolipid hydroxylase (fatty acid hydroxylase superfamily)